MKAFVTGSTGLLGSNLVRLLVEQGYEIKAMARSLKKGQRILGDLDIEIVQGDMQNVDGFTPALAGIDVLFHVAAYFREYYQPGAHDNRLHEINVAGTIQLLKAAYEQGVRNIVYVSSGGVLGNYSDKQPVDENVLYNETTSNLYFQSKIAAEKAIFELLPENPDLRLVLILPGVMIGPGDSGPTTPGQFVIDYLKGNVPVVLPGGLTFVDARDVAQAMLQAVHIGESGERFIVDGVYADLKSIMGILEQVSGAPVPKVSISYPLAIGMAWILEQLSLVTGKAPLITRQAIQTLQHDIVSSSQKAQRELKFQTRPLEESLGDEVRWFRDHGYI